MGFERIRVWRHLFGGASQREYGTLEANLTLQAQAEMRSYLNELKNHDRYEEPLAHLQYVVIDTETTGFYPQDDQMLSVAAVRVNGVTELYSQVFHSYVALPQGCTIPAVVQELTGIDHTVLAGAPAIQDVLSSLLQYIEDRILVAHHAGHDVRFLNAALRKCFGVELTLPVLDTGKIAMLLHPLKKYPSLDMLLSLYEVPEQQRHTADGDAWMTAYLFMRETERLAEQGIITLGQLWERLLWLERVHER